MLRDWSTFASAIGLICAALIPALLVQRNNRRQQRVDEPQKIIDQIQEERAADRTLFRQREADLTARVGRAETRIEGLETQNRIAWDYVLQLRYFIATHQDGPPPTLPEAMRVIGPH